MIATNVKVGVHNKGEQFIYILYKPYIREMNYKLAEFQRMETTHFETFDLKDYQT